MHPTSINSRLFGPGAGLLLGVLVAAAQGDVLVSNLSEPLRGFNIIQTTQWAAQSFRTDSSTYSLTSIEILAGFETDLIGGFAELRRSDPNGNMNLTPGGLLSSLQIPDLSGLRKPRAFLPPRSVRLEPNTLYYFALGVEGSGTFHWSYAMGNATIGPGTLGQYEYCFDGCIMWDNFGTVDPFHIQINVGPPPPPFCEGDPNDDRQRNFQDITSVLTNWGVLYAPNELGLGDSNGDGTVDFIDITNVLLLLGIPCPE